ncbi:glycerol dehydratase reactivase beta/small subunit family protein [Halococcus sp. IIIV-5B]|uniref:glycerol dehydratase reactivase beta/small subunit family protein n=1 Tax=Halococcus sp. IIIV-5B TaxID=2321230 RepID=UPI000E722303|nr:glycerol dehydratase reactivase beta/small subunit family protein [Halococcus sp. IIIV-5B]RJT08033.1 glycerol dehydratase reactivation factor [Halococcus sp. IIIV-5B]
MSGCRGSVEEDEVPRIHIWYPGKVEPESIAAVEHSIEEESVSWVIQSGPNNDPVAMAHKAAIASSLGIGVCVTPDSRIVIHDERLQEDDPVFDNSETTPEQAERLGSNAARLAKGIPLKPISD